MELQFSEFHENVMKIFALGGGEGLGWEGELSHASGQIDMTKPITDFRKFVKAPVNDILIE
jgi:hypothetical protein